MTSDNQSPTMDSFTGNADVTGSDMSRAAIYEEIIDTLSLVNFKSRWQMLEVLLNTAAKLAGLNQPVLEQQLVRKFFHALGPSYKSATSNLLNRDDCPQTLADAVHHVYSVNNARCIQEHPNITPASKATVIPIITPKCSQQGDHNPQHVATKTTDDADLQNLTTRLENARTSCRITTIPDEIQDHILEKLRLLSPSCIWLHTRFTNVPPRPTTVWEILYSFTCLDSDVQAVCYAGNAAIIVNLWLEPGSHEVTMEEMMRARKDRPFKRMTLGRFTCSFGWWGSLKNGNTLKLSRFFATNDKEQFKVTFQTRLEKHGANGRERLQQICGKAAPDLDSTRHGSIEAVANLIDDSTPSKAVVRSSSEHSKRNRRSHIPPAKRLSTSQDSAIDVSKIQYDSSRMAPPFSKKRLRDEDESKIYNSKRQAREPRPPELSRPSIPLPAILDDPHSSDADRFEGAMAWLTDAVMKWT